MKRASTISLTIAIFMIFMCMIMTEVYAGRTNTVQEKLNDPSNITFMINGKQFKSPNGYNFSSFAQETNFHQENTFFERFEIGNIYYNGEKIWDPIALKPVSGLDLIIENKNYITLKVDEQGDCGKTPLKNLFPFFQWCNDGKIHGPDGYDGEGVPDYVLKYYSSGKLVSPESTLRIGTLYYWESEKTGEKIYQMFDDIENPVYSIMNY